MRLDLDASRGGDLLRTRRRRAGQAPRPILYRLSPAAETVASANSRRVPECQRPPQGRIVCPRTVGKYGAGATNRARAIEEGERIGRAGYGCFQHTPVSACAALSLHCDRHPGIPEAAVELEAGLASVARFQERGPRLHHRRRAPSIIWSLRSLQTGLAFCCAPRHGAHPGARGPARPCFGGFDSGTAVCKSAFRH